MTITEKNDIKLVQNRWKFVFNFYGCKRPDGTKNLLEKIKLKRVRLILLNGEKRKSAAISHSDKSLILCIRERLIVLIDEIIDLGYCHIVISGKLL